MLKAGTNPSQDGNVAYSAVIIWSLAWYTYWCHPPVPRVPGYGHIREVFTIIVEASRHLRFMVPVSVALGQDIGVGAAKFNFRKYPVLFPTFSLSLRLKFTTRLPSSLRTLQPTQRSEKKLLWKNLLYQVLFVLINTFWEMRLSIVRTLIYLEPGQRGESI